MTLGHLIFGGLPDRLPHVFVTPRALSEIRDRERRRGEAEAVLFRHLAEDSFALRMTADSMIDKREAVRVPCPDLPAYVSRGAEHQRLAFLFDVPPGTIDAAGRYEAGKPVYLSIPHPTGARASNPGRLRLSFTKLERLHPELLQPTSTHKILLPISKIVRGLLMGDIQPALVVSIDPDFIVAAYSSDMDCVAMLRFPTAFAREYGLLPGDRLTSVNTYGKSDAVASDLVPGRNESRMWTNFQPRIAEFLSDDGGRIAEMTASLTKPEWERAAIALEDAMARQPLKIRSGCPLLSGTPKV